MRASLHTFPPRCVSSSSEYSKLKQSLGIGKRVVTCHLAATSDTELKLIWSGNTWCYREAVSSQTFCLRTSESSFVSHMPSVATHKLLRMLSFRTVTRVVVDRMLMCMSSRCIPHRSFRYIVSKKVQHFTMRPWTSMASKAPL